MNLEPLFYLGQATLLLGLLAAWLTALLQRPLTRHMALHRRHLLSSRFWMGWGLLPTTVAGLIAVFVWIFAALSGTSWLADHCLSHAGHPHLCLAHISDYPPGGWLAIAILAASAGRIVWVARIPLRQIGTLRRLRKRSPIRRTTSDHAVRYVSTAQPLAFTAGAWRPEVYWTEGAENLLDQDEREIVLIHEQSHRRHHDPLKALGLYLLHKGLAGSDAILTHWRQRREVECDRACVEKGHDPARVASTILKMQRAASSPPSALVCMHYARGCDADQLKRRIECLLDPEGEPLGPSMLGLLLSLLAIGLTLQASATHHLLETVLGWFSP